MTDWQTIETAPKDGTVILLSLPPEPSLKALSDRRVFEGRWNERREMWTSANGFLGFDTASHWMHMPEPHE